MPQRGHQGALGRASAVILTAVTVSALGSATPQPASAQPAEGGGRVEVTVMARNLYLGADVGVALELLPDMPAAAQFMWEQVAATDFGARAPLLAAEAARHQPAVIGLQEATHWRCRPGNIGRIRDVFDFTERFLEATRDTGVEYMIAEHGGRRAFNPGYQIPALPFLSRVHDPDTFQPLFGRDDATCGFSISDALLVRADLVDGIQQVGTSEYRDRYVIAPTLLSIDRGYAWADVRIDGATIRFVTTHLESLWDPGVLTLGGIQARQLVDDLESTTLPLVVIGDFNSDPRDPRGPGDPNPAAQPEASETCPAQVADPTAETADATCNTYWTMVQAGYLDAGPDPFDGRNMTWGTNGLLAGPDPARVDDALALGNPWGFTDRLDFVFLRNGVEPIDAEVIGAAWPDGPDVWGCDDAEQVALTEEASARLEAAIDGEAAAITGRGVCLPTDHAGIVARLSVPTNADDAADQALPANARFPLGFWSWVGIAILALIAWRVGRRVLQRRSVREKALLPS